jgi:hypothetical protein
MGQNKKVKGLSAKISSDIQALTYYHVAETATALQVTKAMASGSFNTTQINPVFLVRYQRDEDFVGREAIMKDIREQLEKQNRVAIAGIGGVGYLVSDPPPQSYITDVDVGNPELPLSTVTSIETHTQKLTYCGFMAATDPGSRPHMRLLQKQCTSLNLIRLRKIQCRQLLIG